MKQLRSIRISFENCEAFESQGLKVGHGKPEVMTKRSITRDGLSICKVFHMWDLPASA